jgi:predicted 3-demethylubiquinone-9 3-methyltransferase (glyoxalase superfamily)
MINTCLWFDKQAKEAADFYVAIFTGGGRPAKVGRISRYDEFSAKASGQPEGSVLTVEFELDGSGFMGLNGGPVFKFSPATSFVIFCKTQDEIDYFWSKLADGGREGQCGWIDSDKYGVSWQIIPGFLADMMSDPDKAKAGRVTKAMLSMKKLDIAALNAAAQ